MPAASSRPTSSSRPPTAARRGSRPRGGPPTAPRGGGGDYEASRAAARAEEVSARDSHGGSARVKAARFPATKTLDDFDFTVQTSISRTTIAHLAQLDFL